MNLARALLDLWRLRVVIVAVVALLPAIAVTYPISLPSKLESRPYEVTVIGLAAGTFVFAMGCALILGIVTLVRNLRMPEQSGGPRSSSSTTRTWPRSRPTTAPSSTWLRWDTRAQAVADRRTVQ